MHPQADVGEQDDALTVDRGGEQNPLGTSPSWKYIAKKDCTRTAFRLSIVFGRPSLRRKRKPRLILDPRLLSAQFFPHVTCGGFGTYSRFLVSADGSLYS